MKVEASLTKRLAELAQQEDFTDFFTEFLHVCVCAFHFFNEVRMVFYKSQSVPGPGPMLSACMS